MISKDLNNADIFYSIAKVKYKKRCHAELVVREDDKVIFGTINMEELPTNTTGDSLRLYCISWGKDKPFGLKQSEWLRQGIREASQEYKETLQGILDEFSPFIDSEKLAKCIFLGRQPILLETTIQEKSFIVLELDKFK
jgi:hypothetical protein